MYKTFDWITSTSISILYTNKMVSSSVFDLTVNTFGDFVNEVFSGDDESQKAKLRTKLNQFSKISKNVGKRKPDIQINSVQTKKKKLSHVENTLPPEMLEKILKLLNFKDICQAQLVCKRGKEIIVEGNLVKRAEGKTSANLLLLSFWYIKS